MKSAVHRSGHRGDLALEERAKPRPAQGEVLLKVRACGVCRTDLHVVDEELAPHHSAIVPGHQIVGEVLQNSGSATPQLGARVGVSWLGGVDGTCRYCLNGAENLCDAPTFTGYDRDGGYAEFATARADFTFPIPPEISDEAAAPLLCAGIIGYRALRVAGVQEGERIGLYGFGASAHLTAQVLRAWKCEIYVATRGDEHRNLARALGAVWVGGALDVPPKALDRAITFAPAGDVVIAALGALRRGGVVAINAIHLDRMPAFDYDRLLWGERRICSVTNMTRQDATEFLALAASAGVRASVTPYSLMDAAQALDAVRSDRVRGAAVIVP